MFFSQSKSVITSASKIFLNDRAQRVFQNHYVTPLKSLRNSGKYLEPLAKYRESGLMPEFHVINKEIASRLLKYLLGQTELSFVDKFGGANALYVENSHNTGQLTIVNLSTQYEMDY